MLDGLTMGSVIRKSAELYPNRTAFIFEDERCTYREYNRRVNKAANGLAGMGLGKGDHIAILGRNSITYLEACHAAAKAGLVFGPLNWRLSAHELSFIVSDADNKVLLVEADFQALAAEFLDDLKGVTVVVYGGEITLEGAVSYDELTAGASSEEPSVDVDSDDEAIIMYTSGTTGLPKGAVLTHGNVCWDAVSYLTYTPPSAGDCYLLSMPMSHVSGLHNQTTAYLIRGLPLVIMRQWEPEEACRLIEQHRITVAYILVTPLNQLLDSDAVRRHDLSSLTRIMSAAAKYTKELPIRTMSTLGVEKVTFVYGLSEASPIVSMTELSGQMIDKENTLGSPVWYNQVRIVDADDQPLAAGEVGEIVVKGPNVFKGYYKRPEANADTLRNGWLHTGDLGYLDEDNFLFFVDRKKDMIKSGGENVYSIEVEMALLQAAPELAEAAVVGLPDDKWGEAVTAFVTLKPGSAIEADELIMRSRKYLGGYKVPKAVHVIPELPKNVSGKILKRQLKENV